MQGERERRRDRERRRGEGQSTLKSVPASALYFVARVATLLIGTDVLRFLLNREWGDPSPGLSQQ